MYTTPVIYLESTLAQRWSLSQAHAVESKLVYTLFAWAGHGKCTSRLPFSRALLSLLHGHYLSVSPHHFLAHTDLIIPFSGEDQHCNLLPSPHSKQAEEKAYKHER